MRDAAPAPHPEGAAPPDPALAAHPAGPGSFTVALLDRLRILAPEEGAARAVLVRGNGPR